MSRLLFLIRLLLAGAAISGLMLPAKAQWIKGNGIPTGVRFIMIKDSTLFAGSYAGLYKSTDDGLNWTASMNGLSGNSSYAMAEMDSLLFLAHGSGPYLAISKDNGVSWFTPPDSCKGIYCIARNGRDLYASTERGVVKSSDAGGSWTRVGDSLPGVRSFAFYNHAIYAAMPYGSTSDDQGIKMISDTGSQWISLNHGGLFNWKVQSLVVNDSGIFAATGGGIFRAENRSADWKKISKLIPGDSRCLLVNGSDILAGTGGGLYLSKNMGASWTEIGESALNMQEIEAIAVKGDFLFAGNTVTVWGRFLTQIISVPPWNEVEAFHIYPNPSGDVIYIEAGNKKTSLLLTDPMARNVWEGKAEKNEQIKIDVRDFPAGVYLLHLSTENDLRLKKIVIR